MKNSGVIRRMDDLGRVVIPKEIRRKLCVKEGDPFEISYDEKMQSICFTMYKAETDIKGLLDTIADTVCDISLEQEKKSEINTLIDGLREKLLSR